jgi:D-glycero-beta-D-manno-heptose-7-phosphate kinase
MVAFTHPLHRFHSIRVMVIGDMLLDSYTIGKARRISPEAPVPIVHVFGEENRPGGAGNVIVNILSLCCEVVAVGRIGNDWAGNVIVEALKKEGVHTENIVVQENYITPIKTRVIADNQQVVRIDRESVMALSEDCEDFIIENISRAMDGVQIIALSDYGKGFLTDRLLTVIYQFAKDRNIPVVTDPKGCNFEKYTGTFIIKPNLSEAYAAAQLPSHAHLDDVASEIIKQTKAEFLIITRGEAGIAVFDSTGKRQDFPAQSKEVKDVTGAGDTVLAMLVCAIANGFTVEEAMELCNVAAGLAIEQVGCARISLSDVSKAFWENQKKQKVFDVIDLFMLKEILKKKDFSLLHLTRTVQFSHELFCAIQKIAKEDVSLVVATDDVTGSASFVGMLSSLSEVEFVIKNEKMLSEICQFVPPKEMYSFNGEESLLLPICLQR